MDKAIDERLIVETHFTARRIARLVAAEGAETVDQPIGLRTMVVRQDGQIAAQDERTLAVASAFVVDIFIVVSAAPFEGTTCLTVMVSVPPVSCHRSSLPPPKGSVGLGAASRGSLFVNSMRYTTSSASLVPLAIWNS
jgi:hypothetical protein